MRGGKVFACLFVTIVVILPVEPHVAKLDAMLLAEVQVVALLVGGLVTVHLLALVKLRLWAQGEHKRSHVRRCRLVEPL